MAGYQDLVEMQSREGSLCDNICKVTEGATFRQVYDVVDDADDPVDLTGATFEAKVLDAPDATPLITLTGAGGLGTLTLTASAATMADKVPVGTLERRCVWYCRATLSGQKVDFWGVTGSQFIIATNGGAA